MKRKLLSLTLGLTCLWGLFLTPSAGAAQTVTLNFTMDEGVAWVAAEATAPLSAIEIKVMAPGPGSSRRLWQTCRFSASDAQTYRCGIDVGTPSAEKQEGTWAAKVFSGGVRVARMTFTL